MALKATGSALVAGASGPRHQSGQTMAYVRFLKRINYRNGLVTPATVMELPEDEARAVVRQGWAVEVDIPPEPKAEPKTTTTTRQPSKGRSRGGRKRG